MMVKNGSTISVGEGLEFDESLFYDSGSDRVILAAYTSNGVTNHIYDYQTNSWEERGSFGVKIIANLPLLTILRVM